jgi:hypothetical protein
MSCDTVRLIAAEYLFARLQRLLGRAHVDGARCTSVENPGTSSRLILRRSTHALSLGRLEASNRGSAHCVAADLSSVSRAQRGRGGRLWGDGFEE